MKTVLRTLSTLGALACAAIALLGAWVVWQVVSSPGDDNPVGAIGALFVLLFGPLVLLLGWLGVRRRA